MYIGNKSSKRITNVIIEKPFELTYSKKYLEGLELQVN